MLKQFLDIRKIGVFEKRVELVDDNETNEWSQNRIYR